jgi:hypothetical protein
MSREQRLRTLLFAGWAGSICALMILLLWRGTGGAPADVAKASFWFLLIGAGSFVALLLRTNPGAIWYPFTWFLITTAAYFGFGPLMYFYSNWETINYAHAFYPVDSEGMWAVARLNLVGVSIVILAYLSFRLLFSVSANRGLARSEALTAAQSVRLWRISLIFLAVGLPIRWLLALPVHLGFVEAEVPGVLLQLANLSTLALVPLYLLRGPPTDIRAQSLFLWLAGTEFLYGIVSLSKMEFLKVLIVMALATTLRPVKFAKLAVYGAAGLATFAILVPVVTYARIAIDVSGVKSADSLVQLGSDLAGTEAISRLDEAMPKVQVWWARVNYAPPQLFSIHAFHAGSPGTTFELIPWTFVPRAIYPDKPIMTSGRDFNELVNGSRSSQSAPGYFGEGYWNLGWTGVVLVSIAAALLFVLLELYAMRALGTLRLEYLPVIFLGLFVGIQQDSWVVPTMMGPIVIGAAYHLMARYLMGPFLESRRRRPAGLGGVPVRA